MERWEIRRKNSQALSILCSFGNQVETGGHTCADVGILIAAEVEEKEELKNLNSPFMSWQIAKLSQMSKIRNN